MHIFSLLFPVAGCLFLSGCGGGGSGTPIAQPQVTLKKAVQVAAGETHTCAVIDDGTVNCWGYNGVGELGNGNTTNSNVPVYVSGITNAMVISSLFHHTCAVLTDGTVKCWGENDFGQLGNGTTSDSSTPVFVSGVSNAVSVSAGERHACALLSDNTIKCWGYNYYGQLGNGTNKGPETCGDVIWYCSKTPVQVSGISDATAVSIGRDYSCALLSDQSIKCWGYNAFGVLAEETDITEALVPISILEISKARAIEAGYYHICALLSDNSVKCWGYDAYAQLGDGTSPLYSSKPVAVMEINNALSVSAGSETTCALLNDKTIKCWGRSNYGQIGNGTQGIDQCSLFNINSMCNKTPVTVSELNNAVSVAVGGRHACALLTDGTIKCWGDNYYGELGVGNYTGPEECNTYVCSTVPVAVDASLYATAPRMMKNFYFAFAELLMRLAPG